MTEMAEHLHVQISVMTSPCIFFIFDVVSNERYQIDVASLEEEKMDNVSKVSVKIFSTS